VAAERIGAALAFADTTQAETGQATLVDLLRTNEEPAIREQALAALPTFGPVPLDPVATAAQTDQDPSVRVLALALLGEMAQTESAARSVLREVAATSDDPDSRELAAALLEAGQGKPRESKTPSQDAAGPTRRAP
jgi:hypothetical protein